VQTIHLGGAETLRKRGSPQRHGVTEKNKIKVKTGERSGRGNRGEGPRASVGFVAKVKTENTEAAESTERNGAEADENKIHHEARSDE
jgi:hypothetical protein